MAVAVALSVAAAVAAAVTAAVAAAVAVPDATAEKHSHAVAVRLQSLPAGYPLREHFVQTLHQLSTSPLNPASTLSHCVLAPPLSRFCGTPAPDKLTHATHQ